MSTTLLIPCNERRWNLFRRDAFNFDVVNRLLIHRGPRPQIYNLFAGATRSLRLRLFAVLRYVDASGTDQRSSSVDHRNTRGTEYKFDTILEKNSVLVWKICLVHVTRSHLLYSKDSHDPARVRRAIKVKVKSGNFQTPRLNHEMCTRSLSRRDRVVSRDNVKRDFLWQIHHREINLFLFRSSTNRTRLGMKQRDVTIKLLATLRVTNTWNEMLFQGKT